MVAISKFCSQINTTVFHRNNDLKQSTNAMSRICICEKVDPSGQPAITKFILVGLQQSGRSSTDKHSKHTNIHREP